MFQSMSSLLMMVVQKTHMVDLDGGEIFYHFQLSLVLEKYFGVDLGYNLNQKKEQQGTHV